MSCMSSTRSVAGQSSRTRNENVSSEAILPMQRLTLTSAMQPAAAIRSYRR